MSPRRGISASSLVARVTELIVGAGGRSRSIRQSDRNAPAPNAPAARMTRSSRTRAAHAPRDVATMAGGSGTARAPLRAAAIWACRDPCSNRFSRSRIASASSGGAPWLMAASSNRRASLDSPRSNAATPLWSNSSDSRCRSASALRARSMYARARVWFRSRNNARVQTFIA